jgi:hypothetical protein
MRDPIDYDIKLSLDALDTDKLAELLSICSEIEATSVRSTRAGSN